MENAPSEHIWSRKAEANPPSSKSTYSNAKAEARPEGRARSDREGSRNAIHGLMSVAAAAFAEEIAHDG